MPKNLVMLHLESISQSVFWQYREQLDGLWRMRNKSMDFPNCYAAGTGTFFTLASVHDGSLSGMDCHYAGGAPKEYHNPDNFVEYLRNEYGYRAIFLQGLMYFPKRANIMPQFVPQFDEWINVFSLSGLQSSLDNCLVDKRRPFYMYVHCPCDPSHLYSPAEFFEKNITMDIGSMVSAAINMQDKAFSVVLERLNKCGILDESMVVGFGDHGFNMVDAVARPYRYSPCPRSTTSLSSVPLFIYNSSLGIGTSRELISLDDLPTMLSRLLFPADSPFKSPYILEKKEQGEKKRAYAVTQNKNVLTAPNIHGFDNSRKSYGITDGEYRLIATDVDELACTGGLELYDERMDFQNTLDLLTYFEFDGNGKVVGLAAETLEHSHLLSHPLLINPVGLITLSKRYENLREELQKYVRCKERYALENSENDNPHTMSEKTFVTPASTWGRERRGAYKLIGEGLQRFIDMNRPVLLFGYPDYSPMVMAVLSFYGLEIVGFIDNNKAWHDVYPDRPEVYSPEEAANKHPEAIVISCLMTKRINEEVKRQITGLGLEYYSYVIDILCGALVDDPRNGTRS